MKDMNSEIIACSVERIAYSVEKSKNFKFLLNAIRYPLSASKGFTLIELMLVVIIIGVLSAMVMPKLAGRSEQARTQAAKSDITTGISLALDLYEMDIGNFPDNLEALSASPSGVENWHGPYLKKKPIDPWNKPYAYKYPGDHNSGGYDLSSLGKDGQAETQDDVKNWE